MAWTSMQPFHTLTKHMCILIRHRSIYTCAHIYTHVPISIHMCSYLYTCAHIYTHVPISSSKCVSLYSFSLSLSLHCINAHIHAPALLIVCEHVDILSDSPWTLHTFTDVSISPVAHIYTCLYVSPHGICIDIHTCVAVCYSMLQCVAVCCSENDRCRHLPS